MRFRKLSEHHQKASQKLVDTIYLLQIFNDILDGDGKRTTLLNIILKNVTFAFNEIEKCRKY